MENLFVYPNFPKNKCISERNRHVIFVDVADNIIYNILFHLMQQSMVKYDN